MTSFLSVEPDPNARLRLLCLPYAGGGSARFYGWSRKMPATVQVCPVRLPGRDGRLKEPPVRQMAELVGGLSDELHLLDSLPLAIFGHSLGGLVGFELVRELRRQGRTMPVHLFVSAAPAPQLPRTGPDLHCLPDAELIRALVQKYNGIPGPILKEQALLDLFLPVSRADMEIVETYVYASEVPLECPITAFGGDRDRAVSAADLLGWQAQTRGGFVHRQFSGDHFFLHSAQGVMLHALLEALKSYIA